MVKTIFHGSPDAVAVYRGQSYKPIYVTAAALDRAEAARCIRRIHGPHCIPTLLKQVACLCCVG